MIGGGFIKDMISATRNNRSLVQRESKYQNFDKSYITDWQTGKYVMKFKDASPEYLEELRVKLKAERSKQRIKSLVIGFFMLIAFSIVLFL